MLVTEEDFYFTTFDLGSIHGRMKYRESDFISFSADQRNQLAEKYRHSEPLTMIKTSAADDASFLLCFRKIGVYMDSQGRLTGRSVEWLSLSVEQVIAYPPFVLVFGSRIIEVRNSSNGRLEQVIPLRKDFNIIWDGRNGGAGGSDAMLRIHLACAMSQSRMTYDDNWQELLELTFASSS